MVHTVHAIYSVNHNEKITETEIILTITANQNNKKTNQKKLKPVQSQQGKNKN